MIVRFAVQCDVLAEDGLCCGRRSEEYSAWAVCRMCSDDVCDAHAQPGTTLDADMDSPATCVCIRCEDDGCGPGVHEEKTNVE